MPKAFLDCVKNGGEVFTVKVGKDKYVHGCRPKGSKKAVYGEVKKKTEESKK
jgi:hypothetical protein